jgi:surface antigen
MDGKPDGTTNAWQNPKSGNSGSATLLKSTTVNGQPCRRIRHTVLGKGKTTPSSYVVNICLQKDGSWKTHS